MRIYYTSFKSFSNKSARIFSSEQLLYNKVDFGAPDFEAAVLLQIEVKQKMLGRSVTFGPKSVEKHFQQQNFFELTTPIGHLKKIKLKKSILFPTQILNKQAKQS